MDYCFCCFPNKTKRLNKTKLKQYRITKKNIYTRISMVKSKSKAIMISSRLKDVSNQIEFDVLTEIF